MENIDPAQHLSLLIDQHSGEKRYTDTQLLLFKLDFFKFGISKYKFTRLDLDNPYGFSIKILNCKCLSLIFIRRDAIRNKWGIIFHNPPDFIEISEDTLNSTYGKYWYLAN